MSRNVLAVFVLAALALGAGVLLGASTAHTDASSPPEEVVTDEAPPSPRLPLEPIEDEPTASELLLASLDDLEPTPLRTPEEEIEPPEERGTIVLTFGGSGDSPARGGFSIVGSDDDVAWIPEPLTVAERERPHRRPPPPPQDESFGFGEEPRERPARPPRGGGGGPRGSGAPRKGGSHDGGGGSCGK